MICRGKCPLRGLVQELGAGVNNNDDQDQLFSQWTSSMTQTYAQTHACMHKFKQYVVCVSERWREKQMPNWSWEEFSQPHTEPSRHTKPETDSTALQNTMQNLSMCLPFDFSTLRGKIINKASLFKLKNSFKTCKTVMHNPGNQKIYYIHALTGTGDYGTTDRQVCGFPNIFQSAEFITCGHPWSCRKIWQMIGGNRMYLSVV